MRAHELRAEGFSVAQIAIQMTHERNAADRANNRPPRESDIAVRSVERWLADENPRLVDDLSDTSAK